MALVLLSTQLSSALGRDWVTEHPVPLRLRQLEQSPPGALAVPDKGDREWSSQVSMGHFCAPPNILPVVNASNQDGLKQRTAVQLLQHVKG